MKKKLFFVLSVLLSVLMIASCKKSEAAATSQSEAKRDSIAIAVGRDIATLDLLYAASMLEGQIGYNIYDNLLFFDDEGNIFPYLAESYTISSDGIEYTFNLRKGVKFHNGDELKASDVAFTIEYGKTTPNASLVCGYVKDIKIIDDYSLTLYLTEPMASFLNELCGDQFPIYSEKVVKSVDSYGDQPVGTGAYKYISRQVGVDIKLEAFADHFQGSAPIKYLTYKVLPDNFTAAVALETGDVDFIWVTDTATVKTFEGKTNIIVATEPTNRVNYLSFNVSKAPFDNVKLRQAVNFALNKDQIKNIVYEGQSVNVDTLALPFMQGFAETSVHYNYDPAKAVALAAEAGVSKAKPVRVPFITSASGQKVAEVVQQNLAEIGISIDIELLESNTYVEQYYSGNYTIAGGGFYMVYKDMNILNWFYESSSIDNINTARYASPEADRLFNAGRRESDTAKRTVIYKELIDILQRDAPYAAYANPYDSRAYNAGLAIAHSYADGIWIRDISWK